MKCNHTAGHGASFYLDNPTDAERSRGIWQVVACRGCDLRIGSVAAEFWTPAEVAEARRMLADWAAARGQKIEWPAS